MVNSLQQHANIGRITSQVVRPNMISTSIRGTDCWYAKPVTNV